VEPDSEEETHADSDVQNFDVNQEEPEPISFVEVKCELEVSHLDTSVAIVGFNLLAFKLPTCTCAGHMGMLIIELLSVGWYGPE